MQNRSHMARTLLIAVSALLCTAGLSIGANGVKYTKHNLGSTQAGIVGEGHTQWYSTEETEICVFCHIPHNPNIAGGKKFLWNRPDTTTSVFLLYTASPTLNMADADKGASMSEISKMCMSCHDGVTALNSMANPRPPAIGIPNMEGYPVDTAAFFGDIFPPIPANIGEGDIGFPLPGNNLTNDHPISFNYATARSNEGAGTTLKDPSLVDLPLWDGKVECVTCHDPHVNYNASYAGGNAALKPFLRKTNHSSSLCFTCHDK